MMTELTFREHMAAMRAAAVAERDITCRICGVTFRGRGRARYCGAVACKRAAWRQNDARRRERK